MRTSLTIPPGLVSDDTTFAASGRWADGSNMRFWRGRPQLIGGWVAALSDTVTGVCRTALLWTDNDAVLHVALGTNSHLHVMTGGALYDVTPTGLAAGSVDGGGEAGYGSGLYGVGVYSAPQIEASKLRTWSFAPWGEQLVASPRGGNIYLWQNDTGTPAGVLANAPTEVTYALVASQDMIFALGCNEEVSGAFNPLCIRHSGVRKATVWNTATDTTAREYILAGGGRIVAGRVVGPYLLIWTTAALYLGTYVGSPGQVWRFDRVGERCGLVGPNAAVVVGRAAYWLGTDLQFRRYALGGAVEILPSPIRDAMANNLAQAQGDKIVASSCSQYNEIRFDYPDARDGMENSRYVGLSLVDGSWYRGEMARSAYVDASPSEYPLGVAPTGEIYWHETGKTANGGALTGRLETADQYLSEDQTALVRGLWPDLQGQVGPVHVSIISRFKPQGDETVKGPFAMAPGEDKVDFRISGRLFRLRFEFNSAPASGRFGQIAVDLVPAGRR